MSERKGRPRQRAPLRYDWERRDIYVESDADRDGWGIKRTFYRARGPNLLLNAERRGGGWRWAILAWRGDDAVYDGGSAASLTDAKVRAEAAAMPFDRPMTLWGSDDRSADDAAGADDIPF